MRLMTVLLCLGYLLTLSHLSMAYGDDNNRRDQEEIRVVMAAAFVSGHGVSVYDDIFTYVGKKIGRKVNFVSGFSYSTINKMLEAGMADIGFVCGLPYVMKQDESQSSLELLLAPVMKDSKYQDKPIYYSYLIVHKNSKFNDFTDLKNSTFVYNDEISNSGYNMPRDYLINIGETSGFFKKTLRSGSHEESIRMIALGEADVSAVDSLIYDYDKAKNPEFINKTKIIKTLGPAGIPPVVVSSKLSVSIRNKIRNIMIEMKNDSEGKVILEKALVDRFITVDDSNYNGIRQMKIKAEDTGYVVIR